MYLHTIFFIILFFITIQLVSVSFVESIQTNDVLKQISEINKYKRDIADGKRQITFNIDEGEIG